MHKKIFYLIYLLLIVAGAGVTAYGLMSFQYNGQMLLLSRQVVYYYPIVSKILIAFGVACFALGSLLIRKQKYE